MRSIALPQSERKELIQGMKRETQPSCRLRRHIVLLRADGYAPPEIAAVLYCSRTTVYAVCQRFGRAGERAFADRQRRGPRPKLDQAAQRQIETLVEEGKPWVYGWLRSRWSCQLLALQLLAERGVVVSRQTIGRALHHWGFRWRRPRPVPPPPDPRQKRRRLLQILKILRELVRAGFFFQDETRLDLNPRVGFAWMRRGRQQQLPTPGTNRKLWISGALNWLTGRLHWVVGPQKNSELFVKLLNELRPIYRCYRQLHLVMDNDGSHTSGQVHQYLQESAGRIALHPLPARSPQDNPVELIWWGLHEAITRNHGCKNLEELLTWAERYLEQQQPFALHLGKDYQKLERSPPKRARVQLS